MNEKSAKRSKKKASSTSTNRAKSRTSKKQTTSQTFDYMDVFMSNLKDTSLTQTDKSLSLWSSLIPTSTLEFCFLGTTQSGREASCGIRIGPKGLEYRGPSDEEYRKLG